MKEVPIQWWNFFREHDRTTNVAEAYHSDRFLWNLRQKTSAQLSRILQLEEGAKVKEQSKLYMKLDEELFKKFDQFDEEIRAAGTMEDVSSACQRLVSRAAHLLADAKTVKADRAAERRKRAPPVFSGFLR
ncbi:hypothetical protein L596_027947 [Steinernema carpocapsae]|uniref:Uncharacterized protein n=1 Tax=Steinernema carpocapsae TaxID=34508 RepID=A0A4U5LX29_STECR|nr:hypothetical protein L596_027947 [Steinernema carpocapsae]